MRRIFLLLAASLSVGSAIAQNTKYTNLDRATALFEQKQYAAAQIEFAKASHEASANDHRLRSEIDYFEALCAARLSQPGAEELLITFMANYPNSVNTNNVKFMLGDICYADGRYADAANNLLKVEPANMSAEMVDEYNFKLAHALFNCDQNDRAYGYFRQVDKTGKYAPHAKYYTAYIDYVRQNYSAAKEMFHSLENNPAYEKIIPFYILQIEYLQNNHQYVTTNGAQLLASAHGDRATEIARVLGESWFHMNDYGKALDYMMQYQQLGGTMSRQENYIVGFCDYKIQRYADAVTLLEKAVGADDKLSQNASYHLGGALLKTGDKRRAMSSFLMASNGKFDEVIAEDALFNYGKLQYEIGGGVFNEAINALQRYIKSYPSSPRIEKVREFLVSAYYNSNNYEAAYEAIKQIKNPDNNVKAAFQKIAYFRALENYNNEQYDTAVQMFDESLRNNFNPKYTALSNFWVGEIKYRRGDYKGAIPLYKKYQTLAPKDESERIMSDYNLAYCYFNLNEWSNVESYAAKFLANYKTKDNYRADAHNRMGDAQFSQRAYQKAIDNYDDAIRIGTNERFYAAYQRGVMQGLAGKQGLKVEALNAIIAAGNGDYVDDAMYELGRTYIGQQKYREGVNTLSKFINQYPASQDYINALSEMGLAYQNLGDNSNAMKYYKMVVQKAPQSGKAKDAMIGLREMFVDQNNVDGYIDFAKKSGVATDISTVERDSLSFVAAEKLYIAKDKRAAAALKEYIARYENGVFSPNALYYYSDCQLKEGDKSGAITTLSKLSEKYHNDYTVKGLEKLSKLAFDEKQYGVSRKAYRQLAEAAVNPSTISTALGGYLRSVNMDTSDADANIEAADYVLGAVAATKPLQIEAKYIKAKALKEKGSEVEALKIYEEISADPSSAFGAEAAYIVINDRFGKNKLDEAEKLIFKLSGSNTSHNYWLGKSFLLLGDIYIIKGDSFQARATLQSIVDGYAPANDGIVDAAKEKIKGLK